VQLAPCWIAPILVAAAGVGAQTPAPPALPPEAVKELSRTFRNILAGSLPNPLFEGNHNWGHTAMVMHSVKWHRRGLRLQPEVTKSPRNDGVWQKVRLQARNPEKSLVFEFRDLKNPAADKITFNACLAFDAGVDFERQVWESGIRLYSGSLRARMRVQLTLQAELQIRMELKNAIVPDFVVRLHAIKSDLGYDNLVVEHVAGIGGTGARVLGDALHGLLRRLKPSLERDLIAKGNAAIVKAMDAREVRLSLSNLFKR
jgi:hypothetical protein